MDLQRVFFLLQNAKKQLQKLLFAILLLEYLNILKNIKDISGFASPQTQ